MKPYPEPQDDPAYQKMLDEMAKMCRCKGMDKPCDGLLAGGLCDHLNFSERDDSWRGEDDEP